MDSAVNYIASLYAVTVSSIFVFIMGGLSIITLFACLTLSANALYIYTPSGTPKVQLREPTLADYISWGFTFDGKQSVQSALQTMPKITISKRAVPVSR